MALWRPAPRNSPVGNESPLTTQVVVDQNLSDCIVNPVVFNAIAGRPVRMYKSRPWPGQRTALIPQPLTGATASTSNGIVTALGGGRCGVSGSKPHPYAVTGTRMTIDVNGPGAIPPPRAPTIANVLSTPVSPPPAPPPSPPPSSPPSSPPSAWAPPVGSPPANASPPGLSVFDQFLAKLRQVERPN